MSRKIIFLTLFLMNKLQIVKPLIVVSLILFFSACNHKATKDISEGVMKYKITYLEDKANNPLITLLPSYLEMHFKNNSVILRVEGWMGIFESSFIKNGLSGELITTLKVMNKKYYYNSTEQVGYMGDTKYKNLVIEFDEETKQIINFNCKHAKVNVPSENFTFDLYYTDDIGIAGPNYNTVFEQIPGVLMEFHMDMNGIPMHLIATELIESKVPDSFFCVPEGYTEVEKSEIDTILSSLM